LGADSADETPFTYNKFILVRNYRVRRVTCWADFYVRQKREGVRVLKMATLKEFLGYHAADGVSGVEDFSSARAYNGERF